MSWDTEDLEDLRYHWRGAYTVSGAGSSWEATRTDTGAVLTARSADALRDAIRADYELHPIARPPVDRERVVRKFSG